MGTKRIPGGKRVDFLVRHPEAGWAAIEAKNIRAWLYVARGQAHTILGQAGWWRSSRPGTVQLPSPTSATRTGFHLFSSNFDWRASCKGLVSLMGGLGKRL